MSKLKLTKIVIEILSSIDDSPEQSGLEEIARESYEGSWSMRMERIKAECDKQGTDVAFFSTELEED